MSTAVRQRPLVIGPLRAFEAVARHLHFRKAGEELHLTQSAISRQIQGLEDEMGAPLFQRGTRQVSLTPQGAMLLRAVTPALARVDTAVQQIRSAQARPRVSINTFASFATLWLIPRLEAFQRAHPSLDIRISATDVLADLDDPDVDLVIRFCTPAQGPLGGERLFGEVVTPMASPWWMERVARQELGPVAAPADLAAHTLLEEDSPDTHKQVSLDTDRFWRGWFARRDLTGLQPARWLTFNYTHQQVQAAQAGQGLALGRLPLVADMLTRGDMVEPFGATGRDALHSAYWLLVAPAAAERPEVQELRHWILAQAAEVRAVIRDDPDPEANAGPGEGD